MQFIDDGFHNNAEIIIGGCCKQRQEENHDKYPQHRKPRSSGRGTAILEVPSCEMPKVVLQVVNVVCLVSTRNFSTIESLLSIK